LLHAHVKHHIQRPTAATTDDLVQKKSIVLKYCSDDVIRIVRSSGETTTTELKPLLRNDDDDDDGTKSQSIHTARPTDATLLDRRFQSRRAVRIGDRAVSFLYTIELRRHAY